MHEQGHKHVGGEIGRRMRAEDYCSQISRHVHQSMHTYTRWMCSLLTVEFRRSDPDYYNGHGQGCCL